MMPDLTLSGDEPLLFQASSLRKFRGARLPGSEYRLARRDDLSAHFQQYTQEHYSISYRILQSSTDRLQVGIKEKTSSLRIEIVLEGTLMIGDSTHQQKMEQGQYRITRASTVNIFLAANIPVRYITASIHDTNIEPGVITGLPLSLSKQMSDLVTGLLFNRYQASLLSFYYENCIRELLFLHVVQQTGPPELKLSDHELAAIHEADRIIRENLHLHFSIQELARRTGTNEFKLKRDFRAVFKTGLFGRLLQLRMEHAKHLLQTTSLAIKDIAEKAGYDTVAGFITAFRKYYGSPPGEWRDSNEQNGVGSR